MEADCDFGLRAGARAITSTFAEKNDAGVCDIRGLNINDMVRHQKIEVAYLLWESAGSAASAPDAMDDTTDEDAHEGADEADTGASGDPDDY